MLPSAGDHRAVDMIMTFIDFLRQDRQRDEVARTDPGLEPEIEARSAEIAATRNIPEDIVVALRAPGRFRMFTPSAVGWTAMIMQQSSRCSLPGWVRSC